MRFAYDPEADVLTIRLVETSLDEFRERFSHDVDLPAGDGAMALGRDGVVLTIDIHDASRKYPRQDLERYTCDYEDTVLTLAQAAEHLGVTPQALKKACERGRLAGRKIGRDWTVTLPALTDYANSRQHTGPGSRAANLRRYA